MWLLCCLPRARCILLLVTVQARCTLANSVSPGCGVCPEPHPHHSLCSSLSSDAPSTAKLLSGDWAALCVSACLESWPGFISDLALRTCMFWMVVKEDGHMITARQEPRLVLVSVTSENGSLVLRAPGMDQLLLPCRLPSSNRLHDCRLFGLNIKGRDCGNEVAQWFTSFLKSEAYRLVQFETGMKGRTSKEIFPKVKDFRYQVPYPDASPVLLQTEASLVDLNTRLEKKVKMEYFRPNIVVSGCDAFEEDSWEDLVIGDVELKRVLSCPRCILTTVDPDTGIIDRKEPLQTLKSYRLCDPSVKHLYQSSPLFGVYFTVEKIGVLRVGDPVYQLVD